VLSFFSSRRNWDSPNPSPAGECAPPVLEGGAHSLAREGLGESQFRRGDIHCGTLYNTMVWFVARVGERGEGMYMRGLRIGSKVKKKNEMQGGLSRITLTVNRKKILREKKEIDTNTDMYLRVMITEEKFIRNNQGVTK
jgi:hypothetical protein